MGTHGQELMAARTAATQDFEASEQFMPGKPPICAASLDRAPDTSVLAPISVLGVRISCLSLPQAVSAIDELVKTKECRAAFIVNAHTLNLACTRPGYRDVLNSGDLVLNDGVGLDMAALMQGRRFLANLIGTDFVPELCQLAVKMNYRLFLLGGAEGVAERASLSLLTQFPGLDICGMHHGFFDKENCEEILESIRLADPDILLVGFGNPLQEEWICSYKQRMPECLALGVGALFDYFAGVEPRAPALVRQIRCEWVFRLMVAPRKKWRRYILGNPHFLWRIGQEALKRWFAKPFRHSDRLPAEDRW